MSQPKQWDAIPPDATGRWQITTSSGSVHVLDLDARSVTRIPDLTGAVMPSDWPAAPLRGDFAAVPLLEVVRPVRLGADAVLRIRVAAEPHVVTTRITTPVVRIPRLTDAEGEDASEH